MKSIKNEGGITHEAPVTKSGGIAITYLVEKPQKENIKKKILKKKNKRKDK